MSSQPQNITTDTSPAEDPVEADPKRVEAAELSRGDLLDLSEDRYVLSETEVGRKEECRGDMRLESIQYELAFVECVQREAPGVVLVHTGSFGTFGFPSDHVVTRPKRVPAPEDSEQQDKGDWPEPFVTFHEPSTLRQMTADAFAELSGNVPQTDPTAVPPLPGDLEFTGTELNPDEAKVMTRAKVTAPGIPTFRVKVAYGRKKSVVAVYEDLELSLHQTNPTPQQ